MIIQEQKSQDDPNFRLFNLTVTADALKDKIETRLASLATKANMPGFRPGKVPTDILRKSYEGQLTEEALQEAVNQGLDSIVKEHNLVPAMDPDVHIDSFKPGEDLKCSIGIVPLPSLELPDFSSISITRDAPLILDEHVEKTLIDLQKQKATTKTIPPRTFKEGDALIIDYHGTFPDSSPVSGAEGKDVLVEIGQGSFSKELEKDLLKASVGDTVTSSVSHHEHHPRRDLAGITVTYTMTIKELREFVLPTLDETFATNLGLPSLDTLRSTVKRSIKDDYAWEAQELLKRSLLDHLNSHFKDHSPPKKMVEKEYTGIWQQYMTSRQDNTLSEEEAALDENKARDIFSTLAQRRVRLALVLTTVSRQNEISINEKEIEAAIQQIAQQNPNNIKEVQEHYKQFSARQQLHANLMERKIIDFILNQVNINEQDIALKDFQKKIQDAESFATDNDNNDDNSQKENKKIPPAKKKKSTPKKSTPKPTPKIKD